MQSIWPSSSISTKSPLDFLLATYQKPEAEEAAEHRKILESDSKLAENKIFIDTITFLDDSFSEQNVTNIEEETDDSKNEILENKSIYLSLEFLSLELLR